MIYEYIKKHELNKGIVSVIVPVYNVEKYLDRCIKSIVNQTYKDLEIVLVDDGSSDNCPMMCDKWAESDSRIKVIHKKNQGLGMARNTGMDYATGEYVIFCDSDDYISFDTVEYCVNKARQTRAEMICYGFVLEDIQQQVKGYVKCEQEIFFHNREEIYELFIPGMIGVNPNTGKRIGLWMSLCGCMISIELIHNAKWRCESERNIISEDMYSLLKLYADVTSAVVVDKTFYHYCENPMSLTHRYKADRFASIKKYYKECIKLCDSMNYSKIVKQEICQPFLDYSVATLKQLVKSDLSIHKKHQEFKKIISDKLMQDVLIKIKHDKFSRKQKVLYLLMRKKCYMLSMVLIYIKVHTG